MVCLYNNIISKLSSNFNILNIKIFQSNKVQKLYDNISNELENPKLNLTINNFHTLISTNISESFQFINNSFSNTLIIMIGFEKNNNLNELDLTKNNKLFFYKSDKHLYKFIVENNISNVFYLFNFKNIYANIFHKKEYIIHLLNSKSTKFKIKLNEIKQFINKVSCICQKNNIPCHVSANGKNYLGNIIIDDLYDYDNILTTQLFNLANILNLSNISSKKEKLEYIYDFVCEYLDNEFRRNSYCNFCNDLCDANRNRSVIHPDNGCCYYITYEGFMNFKNNGICKYQVNRKCQIKCIGCKLFTCRYYQKQGVKFTPDNIFLTKYYLSKKSKLVIKHNLYMDKEFVIKKLLEKNKMPYLVYIFTKSFYIKKVRIF